jgi:hypothetical protein
VLESLKKEFLNAKDAKVSQRGRERENQKEDKKEFAVVAPNHPLWLFLFCVFCATFAHSAFKMFVF